MTAAVTLTTHRRQHTTRSLARLWLCRHFCENHTAHKALVGRRFTIEDLWLFLEIEFDEDKTPEPGVVDQALRHHRRALEEYIGLPDCLNVNMQRLSQLLKLNSTEESLLLFTVINELHPQLAYATEHLRARNSLPLARVLATMLEPDYHPNKNWHGNSQRMSLYCSAQSLLKPGKTWLMLDEADHLFAQSKRFGARYEDFMEKPVLIPLLESNPLPTIWIVNDTDLIEPAYIRRFDVVVPMNTPPKHQRLAIAKRQVGDWVPEHLLQQLTQIEHLPPAVLERATKVIYQSGLEHQPELIKPLVLNTLTAQGHTQAERQCKAPLAGAYDPSLINIEPNAKTLLEGLRQTREARLCFHGLPGTGKTRLAQWISNELDRPLISKKASDLMAPFVGQTEQNLASAFEQSEREGAVLLIDEVDTFLFGRDQAARHWEASMVNEFLVQMESFQGLMIATTNRLDQLDSAALRRFDLKLEFKALTTKQTQLLLAYGAQQLGLVLKDDAMVLPDKLAHVLTPGDMAAVIRQSRFNPIKDMVMLINRLESECVLKPNTSKPIGFMP